MAITTCFKELINVALRPANLRLDSLTASRGEEARLAGIALSGHFSRPVFPVPPAIEKNGSQLIFDNLSDHLSRFETFAEAGANDVGYCFDNDYFSSPDAEVLYTVIRHFRPATIIEVGSGNSTRISRQAIRDGSLATRLISVDPEPRRAIAEISDEIFTERVESSAARERLLNLQAGDVLFIDSSHHIRTGNDVVHLFLNILPSLPAGVFVHVHDIFLPYDYPERWVKEERWTEQYLVQAILSFPSGFEVLWPGYYLQRTNPDFASFFPSHSGGCAQSLWLRKRSPTTF